MRNYCSNSENQQLAHLLLLDSNFFKVLLCYRRDDIASFQFRRWRLLHFFIMPATTCITIIIIIIIKRVVYTLVNVVSHQIATEAHNVTLISYLLITAAHTTAHTTPLSFFSFDHHLFSLTFVLLLFCILVDLSVIKWIVTI